MPRIRTIKPEFFTSEDIVALSPLARLLYIALWCESDREGRLQWKPKTFKMRYFPADVCEVDILGSELMAAGLVKLYGQGYAYIPQFIRHQHINPKESASLLPDPHASPTRKPRVITREEPESTGQEGMEGNGKEGDKDATAVGDAARIDVAIPLNDGTEHHSSPEQIAEWSRLFPAVQVQQQLRAMRAWCLAKPARRKTARGVNAFVVGWLSRTQDKGGMNGYEAGSDAKTTAEFI